MNTEARASRKNSRLESLKEATEIAAVSSEISRLLANSGDDFPITLKMLCAFWGGSKPVHPATIYRGIKNGIIPPAEKTGPNTSRWELGKCRRAKEQLLARDVSRG